MSKPDSVPRLEDVDESIASHILSIYPAVLRSFYSLKVKGDDNKRRQALEDDEWRYEQLPAEVQQHEVDKGLSKEQLERLVRWKITHQTNRPFLPPQIRKNDPKVVERCTAEARVILLSSSSPANTKRSHSVSREDIRKALSKVCELTGVGPATGTLILSVYDGQNVPFFEDELYTWLFPNFKGKLKYNVKEYFEMLDKFQESPTLSVEHENKSLKLAEIYEKIAFVCEHWDCVDQEEKGKIQQLISGKSKRKETSDKHETSTDVTTLKTIQPSKTKQSEAKRKGIESEEVDTNNKRSNRSKRSTARLDAQRGR